MTNEQIPASARWVADFINRIGFPVFVAVVLLYILIFKIDRMEQIFNESSGQVVFAVNKNTEAITALRHFLTHKYDE